MKEEKLGLTNKQVYAVEDDENKENWIVNGKFPIRFEESFHILHVHEALRLNTKREKLSDKFLFQHIQSLFTANISSKSTRMS